MSFLHQMKAERDIMALCESFSTGYKNGLKSTVEAIEAEEEQKSDEDFNLDDIYDTVDVDENEAPEGPSFAPDEIELTPEEKEEIKNALVSVLDKIEGRDNISEPALEMIVNEVANDSTYLSESEDANLEGPMEKEGYRVSKVEAAKAFINELLGVAIANDGEVPEDVNSLGGDVEGEGLEDDAEDDELPPPPVDEEDAEDTEGTEGTEDSDDAEEKPLTESFDGDGTQTKDELEGQSEEEEAEGEEGQPDALTEGCDECDDIVDVDLDDTIRVVDDNDPELIPFADDSQVEPIDFDDVGDVEDEPVIMGDGGELAPEVSDDTPLTVGTLKDLFSKMLAEGVEGDKSFAELWKNLAGNRTELSKVTPKGFQKTKSVSGNATLKDTTGNESTLTKVTPKGFQKTSKPEAGPAGRLTKGAESSAKEPVSASTSGIAKKKTPEEATRKTAAAISESRSTISFLREAAEAVAKAKKSMLS